MTDKEKALNEILKLKIKYQMTDEDFLRIALHSIMPGRVESYIAITDKIKRTRDIDYEKIKIMFNAI